MKWGNFGRRLDAHAFAARFVKTVVGRAPDVEVRLSGPLALRLVGRDAKQTVHLDNAFAQYQNNPGALDEILKRWVDGLIAGLERARTIDPLNIVPIVKGRYWIERQRADHLEQHGAEVPFDLYWEPYNTCLIVAYAEFNESLRFVHSADLERSHLDVVTVRAQSLINLRRRTQDWRATGGDDRVVVICADGNLEPSLILLNEVWDDPRLWVDGARLATIAERRFAITAGATNIFHVWQLAADAAESFAKAQYPVARQVFERRGERFEILDDGAVDETHPIVDPDNLDIRAIKRGGGSDLTLLIESPLAADARSIYRLFQKVDGYLRFINAKSTQEQCGPPSPDSTQLVVKIHAASDDAVLQLLAAAGEWVRGRGASLVVERLRVQ